MVICTVPVRMLKRLDNIEMMMGIDVLKKLNVRINCNDKSMTFNGIKYYHKDYVQDNEVEVDYTSPVAIVDELIKRHETLFSSDRGKLTSTDICEMDIETENASPIKQRAYRIPLAKRQIIDQEIDDMLEKQVIQPSKSRWACTVLIVPKKQDNTNVLPQGKLCNKR